MALNGATPFRNRCPLLHEFNGLVHRHFASDPARSQLLDWLAQYVAECEAADRREEERQARRRKYYLEEVFLPGNERLRDGTTGVKGHYWSCFVSDADRLEKAFPSGVPFHLLNGVYYVRKRDPAHPHRFLESRWVEACYKPAQNSIELFAWAPPELACAQPDWNKMPQAPLPPKQLERDYSYAEISWGLAALHDVDSYEPFVPTGHALNSWKWRFAKHALTSSDGPLPDDTWRTSLETLLDKLITELNSRDPLTLSDPRTPALKPSEEKVYNQYRKAVEAKPSLENGTDKAAYQFVSDHLLDDGEQLAKFKTWQRQLRAARKHYGAQKNSRRQIRPHGTSVARADEL